MKNFVVFLVFLSMLFGGNFYGVEIFAEYEIKIRANTDKNSYAEGEKVIVSGTVESFDAETHSNTALAYRALDPEGNMVSLGQATPKSNGSFSFNFDAGGSFFTETGDYSIQLFFDSVSKEISFYYSLEEPSLPLPENDPDTEPGGRIITVKMDGPSNFYLDLPNKIIRASVEIQNYSPSDGQYFMTVTHIPTRQVLKESVIYPKASGNNLWAVQIAYPILESDIKSKEQTLTGEFEIIVKSEFEPQTAMAKFFILESSAEPAMLANSKLDIPTWIKNTAAWWAEDKISEEEFLDAIQYLIEKDLMSISDSKNENIPSITTIYSLPSSRSTEYAKITGTLPERHEGPLTLTVVYPDKSEETITTTSRDGTFMTTTALTSESQKGTYHIFAEIEGNHILVSAFSVKGPDSSKVPPWIKHNAAWWAQNLISDDEFVEGIQYLVERGIIAV